MEQLSTEAQFKIEAFKRHTQLLSDREIKEKLLRLYAESMTLDNMYRSALAKKWGIERSP